MQTFRKHEYEAVKVLTLSQRFWTVDSSVQLIAPKNLAFLLCENIAQCTTFGPKHGKNLN